MLSRGAKIARFLSKMARARLGGGPFFLSHLVTSRCPCRCPTCLWRDNTSLEMKGDEIENLYRDACKEGFVANVLWGGEPFLREDLAFLCRASQREKMLTVVITNGYFLPERYREVAPHLDGLIVSLDYAEAAKHDAFRRCAGLYDRAVKGIQLIKAGYPEVKVIINCLLHNGNKAEIVKVASLARELNVSLFVSPAMEGYPPGSQFSNRQSILAPQDLKNIALQLLELKKKGLPINNSYRYLQKFLLQKKTYTCRIPMVFLNVLADGSVLNCFTPGRKLGNLREEKLEEILSRQDRRERLHLGNNCQKCTVPDVVETSYVWQLSPEPLLNFLRFSLLR